MTGGGWDDEGNLVVGTGVPSATGVLRMPPTGGAATPMLELASGELFHVQPQVLPGGKALLFQTVSTPPSQDNTTVDVVSIADRPPQDARARRRLCPAIWRAVTWSTRTGRRCSPCRSTSSGWRRVGPPSLFWTTWPTTRWRMARSSTCRAPARSCTGGRRRDSPTSTVQWVDPAGNQEPVLAKPGAYLGTPRVSPDGKRIAIAIQDGANQDIWVYEPRADAMTRLTFGGGAFGIPVWTRDGQHVVFGVVGQWHSLESRRRRRPAAGAQSSQSIQFPTSFTPDGTRLAYFQADGNPQLWSVPIEARRRWTESREAGTVPDDKVHRHRRGVLA